jgi:Asp/Glu/hydantoin racemase
MPGRARVVLIHALRDSQVPAWNAFAAGWPEAEVYNLLDDSLSADLAAEGALRPGMVDRFMTLGRYAAAAGANGRHTDAILFTCSAFGPAIEAVKAELGIPVLKPNEAAFEAALDCGRRIGLIVTFAPALPAMEAELRATARERSIDLVFAGRVAEGALAALQSGDGESHDRLIAAAAAAMPPLDALILGQFSAARAATAIAPAEGRRVFTTPDAAVAKLRRLVPAATA